MSSYNNKYVIRSLDVWALRARKNSIYVCMYENKHDFKESAKKIIHQMQLNAKRIQKKNIKQCELEGEKERMKKKSSKMLMYRWVFRLAAKINFEAHFQVAIPLQGINTHFRKPT